MCIPPRSFYLQMLCAQCTPCMHNITPFGSIFGERNLLAIDHIMLALFWSYVMSYFCCLDLASSYWQVVMDEEDRKKTEFVTQGGLYKFRMMPFGLVNKLGMFERLMKRVLCGITNLLYGPDFVTTLEQKTRAHMECCLESKGTYPVGQPARWIEVIDTYDISFQHRPGWKHGNTDALSCYPCKQCGGKHCDQEPCLQTRGES